MAGRYCSEWAQRIRSSRTLKSTMTEKNLIFIPLFMETSLLHLLSSKVARRARSACSPKEMIASISSATHQDQNLHWERTCAPSMAYTPITRTQLTRTRENRCSAGPTA